VKISKKTQKFIRSFTVIITLSISALATYAASTVPGLVPLKYNNAPATDLIYNGKVQLPQELHKKVLADHSFDLAKLNPEESAIWAQAGFPEEIGQLAIESGDSVEYVSPIVSRTGNFRFNVIKNINGRPQTFTIMANKKIHNVLLNRALLSKLGYFTTPLKYLPKITLNFSNDISTKAFLSRLAEATFGDPKRWITEEVAEGAKSLTMQDVIVMPADDYVYNLSIGFIPDSVIKGRRVLNALQIPYAIVDIPESLNLFAWTAGRVISEGVKLDLSEENSFSTSFEDAKWILNRLAKLTRNDFISISAEAYLPEEVRLLLTEKMISRRNSLIELFKIKAPALAINQQLSAGEKLVEGKLMQENWEGHSERFAFGDPESPLSSSEIFAFIKSKFISNIISNALVQINEAIQLMDLQQDIYDKQYELAKKQFLNFLKTGKMEKTSFGFWAIPTGTFDLIASREIVSGSYMGVDNKVQLADTIGFSVAGGAFLGTTGVTAPWALSGTAKASIMRTYTHLQPIKSMKKALKYPFKNIMVPRLNNNLAKIFANIDEVQNMPDIEERKKKLEEIFAIFDESFATGESIIISDSIGIQPMLTAQYGFTEKIKAHASLMANGTVLSRLHIYKKDSSTIQIYKSLGDVGKVGISIGLKGIIPIINIQALGGAGNAKTDFYNLNINSNEKVNPDIFLAIAALRELLTGNSVELVSVLNSPYKLHHSFTQSSKKMSLFFWRWTKQNDQDLLTVAHPSGGTNRYLRIKEGNSTGKHYEQMATDVINAIKDEFLELEDVNISTSTSEQAGNSVFGNSHGKTMQVEGEIESENMRGAKCDSINRPFINITEAWRGWSIKKEQANEIISDINRKFHGRFFQNDEVFLHTKKLILYEIKFQTFIYNAGINALLKIPSEKLLKIMYKYANRDESQTQYLDGPNWENKLRLNYNNYLEYRDDYQLAALSCNPQVALNRLMKILKILNSELPLAGIVEVVGGESNLYAFANVQGFREKEEAGDRPYISNSIGEFGDKNILGPLSNMQNKIEMNENEFYAYWILERF